MQVNDQTMKTLTKYGEVLQTTKNKIVCSLKTGQHLILYFEDDLVSLRTLLIDSNGVQFAKINQFQPQYSIPCENNKDLTEILSSIEK